MIIIMITTIKMIIITMITVTMIVIIIIINTSGDLLTVKDSKYTVYGIPYTA